MFLWRFSSAIVVGRKYIPIAIAATMANTNPAPPPLLAHSNNTPTITIIIPIII